MTQLLAQDPRTENAPRAPLGLRDGIDLAFVLLLTGVALFGFRSTFSGQAYLVAGLGAAVLGAAICSLVTVLRRPVSLVIVLVALSYFVFAAALVFRDDAIGGVLPNGAVVRDAGLVLADGWKQLLTTLPPVAAGGRLLAIPYVIGWLSASIATCVAQRSRARFAPAIAPVLALAAVILLGTATPAARVWQGVVFGAVTVCWAAVRRPMARPLTIRVTPGGPQRLAIGAIVLALAGTGAALLQPHAPGQDRHRVVLRDYVDPPFDIAQYPSPLVGFRKYTKSANVLYDQTLFTVRGAPTGVPLRIATLDDYDGSVWGATNGTVPTEPGEPADSFQRVGSRIAVPAGRRSVSVSVTIAPAYAAASDINAWVPVPGLVRSLDFQGTRSGLHDESFRYNLATGSGITGARLAAGDRYLARSVVHSPALPRAAIPAGAPIVDGADDAFVASRANQWSAKAEGAVAQIIAVGRYMRDNGAYSDGGKGETQYLPGHSAGRLTQFLNAPQLVGDDEQYAAAYALLSNYLGVPSRVVLVAEPQAGGKVQGRNIHTAVEVHLRSDDRNDWVLIPRSKFMPDENKKPDQQPPKTQQEADAAVVPPPNPVQPPSTLDEPDRPDQNTQQLGKVPKKDDNTVLSGWFGAFVRWVGLPLLVILTLGALIVGAKWRRRAMRRTRGTVPNRFDAGWREFVDTARDFGAVVPAGRTRHEQASSLAVHLAGDHAGTLASRADHGVFGPGDPPSEAAVEYWHEVDEARRAMSHRAGRWGRVRAALNLRSLRRPTRATA